MSWFSARVPDSVPSPDAPRTLALYHYEGCPYCDRVRRRLASLPPIELELRDVLAEPAHRRALLERTGRTQVPCLFVDGEPLFESADILAWLEAYAGTARAR